MFPKVQFGMKKAGDHLKNSEIVIYLKKMSNSIKYKREKDDIK